MNNLMNKTVCATAMLLLSGWVMAVQEYKFNPAASAELMLNMGVQNRLQIKNGFLLEVVGDENKYSITWGSDGQNVFITPKVVEGETIDLSLITVGGKTQDLKFTVVDEGAESIVISMSNEHSSAVKNQETSEIVAILKAMLAGDSGKYYVVKNKIKLNSPVVKVSMQQQAFYADKNLVGAVVRVSNSGFKPVALKESDFADIYVGTVAVNLPVQVLAPSKSVEVFIVVRR